jgi:uncharacterized membrane protein (DUF485 family)
MAKRGNCRTRSAVNRLLNADPGRAPDAAGQLGANMEEDLVQKIVSNPKYQQLVRIRTRYGWTLTALMMIVYYGYILLIAFNKELLSARIGSGVLTWGIPAGLFVIVFTVVITGIYVWRANAQFDDLTEAIRQEVL